MLEKRYNQNQMYREALDSYSIVSITDARGIISYANQRFCEISGYEQSELIGQPHAIINSAYHSKSFWRSFWRTIAKGQIWKGEIKNKAKNGQHYWVETTVVPFMGENGNVKEYLSIRIDITARKKAEAVLKVQEELLLEAAFHQSHKIRAPIATMLGLASLARDEENIQELREYNRLIRDQLDILDDLVSTLIQRLHGESDT